MSLNITFSKTPRGKIDTAVVFVFAKSTLSAGAKQFDKDHKGFIEHAISGSQKFTGKTGEVLTTALPDKSPHSRVVLVGLGNAGEIDPLKAEETGGKLYIELERAGAQKVTLILGENKGLKKIKNHELAAHLAAGVKLRSYRFERYKSKKKDDKTKPLAQLDVALMHPANAKAHFDVIDKVTDGVFTARDLVNEPPNTIYPEEFAKRLKKDLKPLGVEVEVLDEKKMQKLGMGAILAVGMGSEQKPRMVVMHWKGAGKKTTKKGPLAFVGKGITFDTGGISLKPGAGMEDMKMDMGGAAAVSGLMKALALRKSKADVVGIVGLAENMPSGNAYRPADILESYAGKTIEVLNTDAEGRLVLADALAYVQKTYKPQLIIDLATLTGAMMVALGHEYCGTFVNDDGLWAKLEKASADTGEKLWRMPLDEVWKKDMESPVADLQNLGKGGRFAGACTAAGFLEHFIEGKTPWAHMDIAGTAWRKSDKPTVPKFGSGFGVRVLDRFVADNYE